MRTLFVFGKNGCPKCVDAIRLLDSRNVSYKYFNLSEAEHAHMLDFIKNEGHRSVPQIYEANRDGQVGRYIGGFEPLVEELSKNCD